MSHIPNNESHHGAAPGYERKAFSYIIEGTTGDGNTYTTEGTVEEQPEFSRTIAAAMVSSFRQLTQGRAVFGKPSVGCCGPYKITRFTLERRAENEH